MRSEEVLKLCIGLKQQSFDKRPAPAKRRRARKTRNDVGTRHGKSGPRAPAVPDPILVKAFRALPKAARANLAWHLAQKTPVFCGGRSTWWTDGTGG